MEMRLIAPWFKLMRVKIWLMNEIRLATRYDWKPFQFLQDLVHQVYESDVSCLSLILIWDNRFEILGLDRLLWFLLVTVQPEFSLRWSFGLQESPQCLPWRPGLEICEVSHKVSKGYLIIVVPENDGFWKSVAVFLFEVSCFMIRAFFFGLDITIPKIEASCRTRFIN